MVFLYGLYFGVVGEGNFFFTADFLLINVEGIIKLEIQYFVFQLINVERMIETQHFASLVK